MVIFKYELGKYTLHNLVSTPEKGFSIVSGYQSTLYQVNVFLNRRALISTEFHLKVYSWEGYQDEHCTYGAFLPGIYYSL